MKKVIKTSLTLLFAISLLTACSGNNNMIEPPTDPIVGTVPESEIPIPSGLTLDYSNKASNLEEMKAACGDISFRGEDGLWFNGSYCGSEGYIKISR